MTDATWSISLLFIYSFNTRQPCTPFTYLLTVRKQLRGSRISTSPCTHTGGSKRRLPCMSSEHTCRADFPAISAPRTRNFTQTYAVKSSRMKRISLHNSPTSLFPPHTTLCWHLQLFFLSTLLIIIISGGRVPVKNLCAGHVTFLLFLSFLCKISNNLPGTTRLMGVWRALFSSSFCSGRAN